MTRVVYIGNFEPDRSTENAVAYGLERAGVDVVRCQQGDVSRMRPSVFLRQVAADADLVLYTRSHQPSALSSDWTRVWRLLEDQGTRTASYHLDVFVGVRRDGIRSGHYRHEPLFTTGTVITPDPALAERIASDHTRHVWMPPAADVRADDPEPIPRPELAGRVLFVGSLYGTARAHPEYPFRAELIRWLQATYKDRFWWIGPGSPFVGSLRGADLWGWYASDVVVVGDSCFAGERPLYWSDRIPETLARGGLLLHPEVAGMNDHFDGRLVTWAPRNLPLLERAINAALVSVRGSLGYYRADLRTLVRDRHTYVRRAEQILAEVGLAAVRLPEGTDGN